jgi:hypothetical protein
VGTNAASPSLLQFKNSFGSYGAQRNQVPIIRIGSRIELAVVAYVFGVATKIPATHALPLPSLVVSVLTADIPAPLAVQRILWSLPRMLLLVNAIALLVATILLRSWHLENIPGINGDEAWSGVQAVKLLRGEPIEWRTPSGNPLNLFFFLPLVALHAFHGPSFVLLRLTPLVSGLVALVANFYLCRRAFDTRTAAVSTLLLAALPIDIAYSRFAWDASQSLLATVLVLYLPLIHNHKSEVSAWPLAAMLAYAAAILVHPTNVLAAPLLVVPMLCKYRRQAARILQNTRGFWQKMPLLGILAMGAVAGYFSWPWIAALVSRFSAPAELSRFAVNYLRLFSGTTVFEYISGVNAGALQADWPAASAIACDLVFGGTAVIALWGMLQRLRIKPTLADESVVIGWFVMLAGFYLVAGAGAIAPHFERYGICLIAPGALVMSRGVTWWFEQRRGELSIAMVALVVWLWPASFYLNYFYLFEETGGRSHRTFRTAAVEPKLAALRHVLAERNPSEPARIFCSEWWNYWPLEYLALGEDNVRVSRWEPDRSLRQPSKDRAAEETWFVEFTGSAGEAAVVQWCKDAGLKGQRQTICDYAGRPLISVIRPREKLSQNY